jgi:hypothetical protein
VTLAKKVFQPNTVDYAQVGVDEVGINNVASIVMGSANIVTEVVSITWLFQQFMAKLHYTNNLLGAGLARARKLANKFRVWCTGHELAVLLVG